MSLEVCKEFGYDDVILSTTDDEVWSDSHRKLALETMARGSDILLIHNTTHRRDEFSHAAGDSLQVHTGGLQLGASTTGRGRGISKGVARIHLGMCWQRIRI